MKKTIISVLITFVYLLLTVTPVRSQISVTSTDGYTVNIVITPKAIVPVGSGCQYGYNYNVNLNYSITFTGTNIPSSLYTLQGTIGCGSSALFFDLPNSTAVGNLTTNANAWTPTHDCATATVTTLLCNTVNIEIAGPGIPSRTISIAASPTPVPVKLIDFTANITGKTVSLKWATATESNNQFFTVERSNDAANWVEIKKINGAINSSSVINYEAADENPFAGTSYYRLKQTDLDGHFTYSATRIVKYSGVNSISVYPVPNTGNTINFSGIAEPKNMALTVRNATGVSMFATTLSSANSIQLPALAPGLYVISLTNKISGETTNLRYIKM